MVTQVGGTRAAQVGQRYGASGAGYGDVAAVANSAGCRDGTTTQQGQGRIAGNGCGTGIGVDTAEAVGTGPIDR